MRDIIWNIRWSRLKQWPTFVFALNTFFFPVASSMEEIKITNSKQNMCVWCFFSFTEPIRRLWLSPNRQSTALHAILAPADLSYLLFISSRHRSRRDERRGNIKLLNSPTVASTCSRITISRIIYIIGNRYRVLSPVVSQWWYNIIVRSVMVLRLFWEIKSKQNGTTHSCYESYYLIEFAMTMSCDERCACVTAVRALW